MAKVPKCKKCQREGHYQSFCTYTPKKPITRSIAAFKSKKSKTSTRPKKKSRTPRQTAKDKAWKAFSDYIRLRDCLATTGTPDNCVCVTCNVRGDDSWKPYAKIQAGHAVGGRGNAVLFHEEIVNGQCSYCNTKPPMGLGGDYGNYMTFLVEKYGLDHAKELQKLRYNSEIKYKINDFLEIEQRYKEKKAKLLT